MSEEDGGFAVSKPNPVRDKLQQICDEMMEKSSYYMEEYVDALHRGDESYSVDHDSTRADTWREAYEIIQREIRAQ